MNISSAFLCLWHRVLLLSLSIFFPVVVFAQGFPNTTQGTPGSLILGPIAPQMGRTAIVEYLGGYIISWPEAPGSESGDDLLMRAWDFSDPQNPREVTSFGRTTHGMDAHATIKRGNQVWMGGNQAITSDGAGNLSVTGWRGPYSHWSRSGMYAPWYVRNYWSYGEVGGDSFIELDGERLVEWDHLGQTGVVGFPHIMGNVLIYASDQSTTGVASYDISDPANPRLLDVINTPSSEGGIGGYWSEIYGQYVVIARRWNNTREGAFAGLQVVDFSDPSNLRMHCNIRYGIFPNQPGYSEEFHRADPMYVGFQDEFVFTERFKINIETCTTALVLDVGEDQRVETSQYARPLGNLLITGGYPYPSPQSDGLGIWVHQSEPDTRSPFVSYHIPRNNQTNYPVNLPISVHIPETLQSETINVTETPELGGNQTLTLTEVGGDAVRIDYVLSHTGLMTISPVDDLNPNTTYELRLSSAILDAAGNGLQAYSFRFSTGSQIDSASIPEPEPSPAPTPAPTPEPASPVVQPPVLETVSLSPSTSVELNEFVTVTAVATDSSDEATEYQFELSNQTGAPWVTSSSQNFQFDEVGVYSINVRARNSAGVSGLQTVQVRVQDGNMAFSGNYSSQLYCAADGNVWGVNPDNNSVVNIDASDMSVNLEHFGVDEPRSVAVSSRGHVWVTSMDGDRIDIFDNGGNRIRQLNTDYGSAPYGIVMSPDGNTAYVSLYGSGELARFNTQTIAETGRIELGPTPRALALSPDGSQLLVTRFISSSNWGEVWEINTAAWSLTRAIRLDKNLTQDAIDNGRGVPNYLSSIIVNADGSRAYVVGKKDNVDRGLLGGLNLDLDDDSSVRTIGMTINLENGQELRGQRIDFDNTDSPSSLALSSDGTMLFVGMQGINQVFAIEVNNGQLGGTRAQLATGRAPQGLCIDYAVDRLFVKNFMERTVNAIDVSGSLANPENRSISTVSNEVLSAEVLAGKRIFYDAANGRQANQFSGKMSAEGYISCATCHIDGGHDGRTYDFTGRGEGLRNNISLKGRSGVRFGNVHWTANFDEIQDFEHDIRDAFRGSGFMADADFVGSTPLGAPKAGLSEELDSLAAYVSSLGEDSLPKSPYRQEDGSITAQAERGRATFERIGCAGCHSGEGFTDGLVHNVGTLRSYSGGRLGETIEGIKTPSLLSVFDTAPYLHDGSAQTLAAVFSTVGGTVYQAEDVNHVNSAVVSQLGSDFSYLRSGRAVRVPSETGYLDIENVDGGSGGEGLLRLRFGSNAGTAVLGVWVVGSPGEAPMMNLSPLPQVEGSDVAFTESQAVVVPLAAGTNNTIRVWVDAAGSAENIVIDDVTVSNADDVAAARSHTVAGELSSADSNDLQQYLLQIDRFASTSNGPQENSGADESGAISSSSSSSATTSSVSSSGSSSAEAGGATGLWLLLVMSLLLGRRFGLER